MPRKTKEELEAEVKAKKEKEEKVTEEVSQQQQGGIVEVPINLELLNNKLNYLITRIDQLMKLITKE